MVSSLITDSDFYFMLKNAVKCEGNGTVERGWRYSSTHFYKCPYIEISSKAAIPPGKEHLLSTE